MRKIYPNYTKKGVYFKKRKVLKFNNGSDILSDKDIINLFTGLCKLISKNCEKKIELKYLSKINNLEKKIKLLSIACNK